MNPLRTPRSAFSAVGFLAVGDGVDAKSFLALTNGLCGGVLGEADAVVANSQALFAALAFERLDPSRAGFGETVNGREDIHGDWLRDGANVGSGLLGKDDPLHADSVWLRI